jgi:hypothetical protein
MKRTLISMLASAAALFLTAPDSQAEILIYKGTNRCTSDLSSPLPPVSTFFGIVDTDHSTIASISLLTLGGKKLQVVSPPTAFSFTTPELAGGRSVTTMSLGIVSGSGNADFSNFFIHFRGVNTSLKVTSAFGGTFKSFPRALTGLAVQDVAAASSGSFLEQRIVASYQQARSIAANDANLTIQQALDLLSAELKKSGFQP